ncbi:MAG: choice-of-anchor D domain-containing protein [Kofleriaceae bacterium]
MRTYLLGMSLLGVVAAVSACGSGPTLGTAAQALAVSPAVFDFGPVQVGAASAPRLFVVSALDGEDEFISAVTSSCPDVVLDTSTLALPHEVFRDCGTGTPRASVAPCASANGRFTATFAPTFTGPQSCTIAVSFVSGQLETTTVTGTGTAPPIGQALVTPVGGALNFGGVVVGTSSSPLPITLQSIGQADLTIQAFDLSDPALFTVAEAGPSPVPPGETHTWAITCTPASAGAGAGTATITTDAPGSPITIQLQCEGIESELALAPSPVQFAETLIGATASVDVVVTNIGTANLTFGGVTTTGAGFTASAPGVGVLGPTEATTITVSFTPDPSQADSDVIGTLDVAYDTGTRSIELVGPARDVALSVSPSTAVDLGTVCAGQLGAQLFAAVNGGSGAAEIADISVVGDGFALELLAPAALPAVLPPRGGGAASFRVTAAPPDGDVDGTLTVTPTAPGVAPIAVALHARGQASGIGTSPTAVAFGGVLVGESSGGRTVRISNCDPTPLELASAAVTGVDAGEFIAVAADQTLPTVLAPGADLVFVVELRPATGGAKAAALTITHGDGTETSVALTGEGIADDLGGGGGGRGSYYACSTGGPAGLGVLGLTLAVAAVTRRRRWR